MSRKKFFFYAVAIVMGAVAGYLYYYYIGCRSGSCPLRANPFYNVILGSLIGYLLFDVFYGLFTKKRNEHHHE